MRKILIVYATAGIGHKKASVAVKKAFDELAIKDAEASIIDSLDYTNAFFKWAYLGAYLVMVNSLPLVWGFFYYLTDNALVNFFVAGIRRFNNWLNSWRLVAYLLEEKPDAVVSTHFFATEVISHLKKKGVLKTRLINVVTDYKLHLWWVSEGVDTYVVGSALAREDLLRLGVSDARIRVLGIPAEPVFSKPLDRDRISDGIGFEKGVFTVLVIGGGFGVGPIEEIVKAIDSTGKRIQVIAICGHNDILVRKLEDLRPRLAVKLKILGFVDNVYEYMEVSDCVISKSGGITVTESLAKGLPMIVIAPIIGQETRNCDYLIANRAALRLKDVGELRGVLIDLASHPDKIEKLRESIKMIRKPMAAYDIARLATEASADG